MIPSTVERVPLHTAEHVNEQIREQIEKNLAHYAGAAEDTIDRRLAELNREWDIERTLEANAAVVAGVGAGLALMIDRRFALIPLVVGGFLLQHAIQGWCPPMPVFRRLGVRTSAEIDAEYYALKALRGDFEGVTASGQQDAATVKQVAENVRR